MKFLIREAWGMKFTLLFAVIFGIFISPASTTGSHFVYGIYDSFFPVVTMTGSLVRREGDGGVVIHLAGKKNRACRFVQLDSFSKASGILRDATETRVDGVPQNSTSSPVGPFDQGNWLVWPTTEADQIVMYVEHDCDGRIVTTKIAEVKL